MSLPIGSVVTDVTLESLSATNQISIPITFGQVFKVGDMLQGESLAGRIGKVDQPLQYEVKATHADGSVRHAIISVVLPAIPAKQSLLMQLVKVAPSSSVPATSTVASATVSATINGVKYSATADNTHLANKVWLSGSYVQEKHFNLPLTTSDGTEHPHLYARFALRDYTSVGNVRADVTVENNWAYEAGPQNFKYDLEIQANRAVVYSKAALTHLHHARWRKLYWLAPAPQVNVKSNIAYLIASKAVANYDQSTVVAQSLLAALAAGILGSSSEPMNIGLATDYMPMTGAHNDIGLLPEWAASWLLSMDSRARDASLVTATLAGSWSMHYRDKKTDRPISLLNYPYMTVVGNYGDTRNPATGIYEAFPGVDHGVDGTLNTTPYSHDSAHQPSFAYLPYLLTGDYYFLEELQFWATYDVFCTNPNYRGNSQGIVQSDQVRGQAWSLRTLAHAAYITPDNHPDKASYNYWLDCNLEWYNSVYANDASNTLGIITNGAAYSYDGNTAIAQWQDDFFTQAIGQISEFGYDKATKLLKWKAKYQIGRLTAPGVCWLDATNYSIKLRDTSSSPVYSTLAECFQKGMPAAQVAIPCDSPMRVSYLNANNGEGAPFVNGQLQGWAASNTGYPSNYKPALAMAVDSGVDNAHQAWDKYMSQSVQADYSTGPQFNIVPRTYVSAVTPIIIVPYAPPNQDIKPTMPGTWIKLGNENDTVSVLANTYIRYGARNTYFYNYTAVAETFVVGNKFFGGDPIGGVTKTAEKFMPDTPISTPPIKDPIMTFKVSVALSFANQTLPAGSDAAVTSTLVELLAADGVTVVASSASVYEFSGINTGDYVVRASGIDSKGAVMGVPYTQAFSIVEEPVVTPPVDTPPVEPAPQPVDVALPSGMTISYVKE